LNDGFEGDARSRCLRAAALRATQPQGRDGVTGTFTGRNGVPGNRRYGTGGADLSASGSRTIPRTRNARRSRRCQRTSEPSLCVVGRRRVCSNERGLPDQDEPEPIGNHVSSPGPVDTGGVKAYFLWYLLPVGPAERPPAGF